MGGDERSFGGAHGTRGGDIGGDSKHYGSCSFRKKGGHRVNHIRGDTGDQQSGPEGRGIDVIEPGLDVQEPRGDFQHGSLQGLYFVYEGEAGIGGAEYW